MSRITKEEIEKTKCGRFLLSDENIYLSIYSLNSYVWEMLSNRKNTFA